MSTAIVRVCAGVRTVCTCTSMGMSKGIHAYMCMPVLVAGNCGAVWGPMGG